MKTMKKFLSMAALAMVGAMTGCSSEDNVIDQAQTATKNNVVTQTVTVGFDEQAATRALAIDYDATTLKKTFKANDQIAVVYQNTSDKLVKATVTIAAGDISTDKKSATFTVSMTDPKASGTLKYIYPAAMAGATDVDYTKLNTQDGTLASLASNLDLATFEGTLTAAKELPASASLANKLSILTLKIKNSDGTSDITSTITGMTLSDGTNSYSITGKDTDGHIYAAIQATSGAKISCFATTTSGNYAKSLTGKTYAANNIYDLGLKMEQPTDIVLSGVTDATTIQNGQTVSGTLGSNVQISIADGAIVTLKDVTINGTNSDSYDWAGITCAGDATIILEGINNVKGFDEDHPGIFAAEGKTLTIKGPGTLNVSSNGEGAAGIGGGDGVACGNIVISGGTITATGGENAAGIGSGQPVNGNGNASCGNITISGGTITATGGDGAAGIGSGRGNTTPGVNRPSTCGAITISGGTVIATGGQEAAGIGSGRNGSCGTITITSGVTSVTATKGTDAPNSIGSGKNSTCGTVTIDAGANVIQKATATAHELSASVVGDVVATDGNAYTLDATHVLPSGVTAVAMVAYKSATTGKSLAIQLNGSPVSKNWDDAKTYAEGLTAVSGHTWRLPSKEDWQNMFAGCAVSGDAIVPDAYYKMNPIAGFKAKIAATGITWMSNTYWSSTETTSSNAWYVRVSLDGSKARAEFGDFNTTSPLYVLGCLAF